MRLNLEQNIPERCALVTLWEGIWKCFHRHQHGWLGVLHRCFYHQAVGATGASIVLHLVREFACRREPYPRNRKYCHVQRPGTKCYGVHGWIPFSVMCISCSNYILLEKPLEGEQYEVVSMLVSYINDLRNGLNHKLNDLKLPGSGGDRREKSGGSVHEDTCQRRRQPIGGWREHLRVHGKKKKAAMSPRTKSLYRELCLREYMKSPRPSTAVGKAQWHCLLIQDLAWPFHEIVFQSPSSQTGFLAASMADTRSTSTASSFRTCLERFVQLVKVF